MVCNQVEGNADAIRRAACRAFSPLLRLGGVFSRWWGEGECLWLITLLLLLVVLLCPVASRRPALPASWPVEVDADRRGYKMCYGVIIKGKPSSLNPHTCHV